jgi:hypothetical protein
LIQIPEGDEEAVTIFDNFRPEALEYLLQVVEADEKAEKMKKDKERDLYANSTNLYSVIERGEEYEAD